MGYRPAAPTGLGMKATCRSVFVVPACYTTGLGVQTAVSRPFDGIIRSSPLGDDSIPLDRNASSALLITYFTGRLVSCESRPGAVCHAQG